MLEANKKEDNNILINFLSEKLYQYRQKEKEKHDLMISIQISMIERGNIEKNSTLYNKGVDNMNELSESLIDINAVIDFLKESIRDLFDENKDKKKIESIFEMKLISPVLDAKMKTFYDSMDEETLIKEKEKMNIDMKDMLVNKKYDDFKNAKVKYDYIQEAITEYNNS
jgi:hypothetical protein